MGRNKSSIIGGTGHNLGQGRDHAQGPHLLDHVPLLGHDQDHGHVLDRGHGPQAVAGVIPGPDPSRQDGELRKGGEDMKGLLSGYFRLQGSTIMLAQYQFKIPSDTCILCIIGLLREVIFFFLHVE